MKLKEGGTVNLFNKLYFERCKEEFGPMGFIRKGNFFTRVVNGDVIQSFCLQKWGSGNKCEIQFGISPLCRGERPGTPAETYKLSRFAGEDFFLLDCKGNDEEISKSVEIVIANIKKYIIPSFEKAEDSFSALDETVYLDKLEYGAVSKRSGKEAHQKEFEEKAVNLADNAKYFFALKTENYQYAKLFLEAFFERQLYSYGQCKATSKINAEYPKENLANCEAEMALLNKEISYLEKGEYDYFRNVVKENEEKNRKEYKKFIK